jgi:hypothetical protein
MKKLGMMVLILLGALTLPGHNCVLAKGLHGHTLGKDHFDKLDTNKDGKISRDEYMAKCTNRFKAMDANNDGFVTQEEYDRAREKVKEKMMERREKRGSQGQTGTSPMSPEGSKSMSE